MDAHHHDVADDDRDLVFASHQEPGLGNGTWLLYLSLNTALTAARSGILVHKTALNHLRHHQRIRTGQCEGYM